MNDLFGAFPLPAEPSAAARPALPVPTRTRWQPLRLGLVELFHYDSEEFWFRDGHLLLRGNNGAGKSKVLSLTMPFLFDAQMKASRIEPDGDGTKKMAWNLLMNGYDRRIGYAWIEFGRIAEDGAAHYLTLGAGLSAVAARPQVESWFFVLEGGAHAPRVNQDLWLISDQRVVFSRERLREAIGDHGQVFDTGAAYRRAVDERLFHLGAHRYEALMDTLIQLRQPQLSRKPDENALSDALTEALPPLAPELLGDVAEALGQLDEDRRQLEGYQALAAAVDRFERRYRVYAGAQTRRQARSLRQAQSEFERASRARAEALAHLKAMEAEEARATAAHGEADLALTYQRARLDTLLADPAMQDANRLEHAAKDALARRQAADRAGAALEEARHRLRRAIDETAQWAGRVASAEERIAEALREGAGWADAAGLAHAFSDSVLASHDFDQLANLTADAFTYGQTELRTLTEHRREEIAVIRSRHAETARMEMQHARHRQSRDERREEAEAAVARRRQADAHVERAGQALAEGWVAHFAGLRQLRVTPDEPIAALAEWVTDLEGENPARRALETAQQAANLHLAGVHAQLRAERQAIELERDDLGVERARLVAGADTGPPAPHTRGDGVRDDRAGAPLWRLLEFQGGLDAAGRAGLEAALEAAGLLDAWVSPDGQLHGADGAAPLDTWLAARPARPDSLARWLRPDIPSECPVPSAVVERLLAGVACGAGDPPDGAEAWIGLDGRFRMGPLAGAWSKPAAAYVGFTARAAARARRIAEIDERLAALAEDLAGLAARDEAHALAQRRAEQEWRDAPDDRALREAHLAASAAARDDQAARERLALAEARDREAEGLWRDARGALARDAADLRLPDTLDALAAVEAAVGRLSAVLAQLTQAVGELRLVQPELTRQRAREDEARQDFGTRHDQLSASRAEAEEADARLAVLSGAVGAKVEELKARLAEAREAVAAGDGRLKAATEARRVAGEARAVAGGRAEAAEDLLLRATEARGLAIDHLQKFAATGLVRAALPDIEIPDQGAAWTIDPALTLARRAEQALVEIRDDDDAWSRIQRQIAEEFTELQRALSALGHHAMADTTDWGMAVSIVYQGRPERPDRLAARLAAEIAQREELLTANERTVLENHLQAEIAAEIQRLLQLAERQLDAINKELHKRPTSTGVRYRLLWQPLAEADGAPVGLEGARRRLLNISADLWSAEDRRVVGAMLQQRIAAERERGDTGAGRDAGASLFDQLARALDYRRWHRFRVERWQDGLWRKLSGPASSGERALGLTVPLFAAVASFYSQGGYAAAPRLMLLDEAFAGIDDTARAHCMGLIREFDLDFIITSEREWACYAELPGVSICHLQRREGVDAVFVSRWTWDGRSKVAQADPDRRFAPV